MASIADVLSQTPAWSRPGIGGRAELYAGAAGVALGRVIQIDEVGGGGPVPVAYGRMMAEAAAPPVAPGQLDLSASVTVRFAIAP